MSTTLVVAFSSRRFRADLRDRLRLVAAMQLRTNEDVLNDAVEIGLTAIERELVQDGIEQLHAIRNAKAEIGHG